MAVCSLALDAGSSFLAVLVHWAFPVAFDERQCRDRFHGLSKCATDLKKIRTPLEIGGQVLACSVEKGGIEEGSVAVLLWQADIIPQKVSVELGQSIRHKTFLESLNIRQESCRPATNWHVSVRHSSLQCEQLAGDLHSSRVSGNCLRTLKTHNIDLGRCSVCRAKPHITNERRPGWISNR